VKAVHANNITLETARERETELLNLAAPKVSTPRPVAVPRGSAGLLRGFRLRRYGWFRSRFSGAAGG
jgi:hypothetical protein